MENPNFATYTLTIFAGEYRWEGKLDIPAHRRVSDYINDRDERFLKLRDAQFVFWQTDAFDVPRQAPVAVLVKQNIVVVVPSPGAAQPPGDPFDSVEKVSRRLSVHIPPLLLQGEFHSSRLVDWIVALNVARADFIPLTNVTIWHYRTSSRLHENLPLVLAQVQRVVAFEPEPSGGDTV